MKQNSSIDRLYKIEYSNGSENFYLINKTGGGMFSILSAVLCHLDLAEKYCLSPIIDFKNFKTTYSDGENCGTSNAWEYYFQPVNSESISSLREKARLIVIPEDYYPAGYSYCITQEPHLYEVFSRWINLRPELQSEITALHNDLFSQGNILGVHFRGQEMRTAPGHHFPPTKSQIALMVDGALNNYDYEKIFIVSEEASYIDWLKLRYGSRVISTNSYRTYGLNAYREYPREKHIYKLGKEVIIDAYLLSKCSSLIACTSNVAEFARFINHGRYIEDLKIRNGQNSSIRYLAKYLWFIKALLPSKFGGFSLDPASENFINLKI